MINEDEKKGGDEVKNEDGIQVAEVELAGVEDDEDKPLKEEKKQENDEEDMEPPKKKKIKEPTFPKLHEVAESTSLTRWSFFKVLLYFVLALMALTLAFEPNKIVDCNQQTIARWPQKIACIKSNATFSCRDANALACKSMCPYPQMCQIPLSAPNQDNPPFVLCLTLDTFQAQCVDTDSCTTSAKSAIFLAYLVLAFVQLVQSVGEILFALSASVMSTYTEEDFALNEGFGQKASIALVKTMPLLTVLLHFAFLGVLLWVNTVNQSAVQECALALTTAGTTTVIDTRSALFWYIWLAIWFMLTVFGYLVRTRLKLNEFLFSPTDEFPRNSGAIDWDCPQLRVRRDPTEPSACKRFLQLVAYKCVQGVIKLSGLLYYVIANRKMLGA